MTLFPIQRDWSAYRWLHIEFTVSGRPLPVTFSVRDGRRAVPPKQRFDQYAVYSSGRHRATIDMRQIARGSAEVAPVDVAAVQSFHIIVGRAVSEPVRLHRIWLE